MKIAIAACALLLAGCGGQQVIVQKQEVPVPVRPVAAKDVPEEPKYEFPRTAPTDPVDVQVKALLIDREEAGGYAKRLRALVDACVGPQTPLKLPTIE